MPSSKYSITSSRYYTRLFTHLFQQKKKTKQNKQTNKNEFNISATEMLQKKINRLYYIFPNEFALTKLCTCACFPVTSVPRVASTAIWSNSIVALRVHVTGRRQSGAFIQIFCKDE